MMQEQESGQPPSRRLRPHRGTVILVFGILGLVVCVIFGIVAWVMGNNDLNEMRAGRMDPSGNDLTQAGRICGMVAVGFAILGVLALIFFFAMGAAATTMH